MKPTQWLLLQFVFLLLVATSLNAQNKQSDDGLFLWYTRPATDWMTSALPIGNGRIGAMIFGGIKLERVQFNDKTLWTGSTSVRGAYQNFGDIYIDFDSLNITDYRRELDIENAVAWVTYKSDSIQYTREYLASFPDNVIAMRFTAGKKGKLNFSLHLQGAHDEKTSVEGNIMTFDGKLELLSYETRLSVQNEGGSFRTEGNYIMVTGANTATIYLTAATNYDPARPGYLSENNWQADMVVANEKTVAKGFKPVDILTDFIPVIMALTG